MLLLGINQLTRSRGGMPSKSEYEAVAAKSMAELKDFKSAGGELTMKYPGNWNLAPLQSPQTIFHAETYKGVINANLGVEPWTGTVAAYTQLNIEQLTTQTALYKLQKLSEEAITIAGVDAVRVEYAMEVAKDLPKARNVMVFYVKDAKAYLLTATAIEEMYPAFKPTFLAMAESIRFP